MGGHRSMLSSVSRSLPKMLSRTPLRTMATMPLDKVVFTSNAKNTGGGRANTEVSTFGEHHGNLTLQLEKHPAHGGKGGASNPEELFAMGYASCFNGALQFMANAQKID